MWDARAVRRIGHRGAKGHSPENTIESFAKALELGCDEIETDVWLADDGRLLISHDRPGPELKLTLRSEEHTSELQSHSDIVCRLLLEKKNNNKMQIVIS